MKRAVRPAWVAVTSRIASTPAIARSRVLMAALRAITAHELELPDESVMLGGIQYAGAPRCGQAAPRQR